MTRHEAAPDDQESYLLYIVLIFGIALILRVLVVMMGPGFGIEQAHTAQTPLQMELAQNLAEHQTFGLEAQPPHSAPAAIDTLRAERGDLSAAAGNGLHPEFYQLPGYPAVLSVFLMAGIPLNWLLMLQALTGALLVPLVFKVGLALVGRKLPSVLAGVFVALHPALLIAPASLAGDTFVAFLVLLGLLGVSHAERRGVVSAAGSGLALGTAALFSTTLAWFAPVVGVWIVVTERRIRSFVVVAALMAGTAVPIGAWVYRNHQHGLPPQVHAGLALDRYFGTAAAMRDPGAGPYAPQTMQTLFGEFHDYTRLPENADQHTLSLLDSYGRDRVSANHHALLETVGRGATVLGLDHSLHDAYRVFNIDYAPSGYAADFLGQATALDAAPDDPATPWIINGWVALNAAIVAAMVPGALVMLWRRRFAALLLMFSALGFFVYLSAGGADESMRLPLIGLQALLVMGYMAPRAVRLKTRKLKKMRKLDGAPDLPTGSPLTTADSLRAAHTGFPTPAPEAAAAGVNSPFGSLTDTVHPALRGEAPRPETGGGRPV